MTISGLSAGLASGLVVEPLAHDCRWRRTPLGTRRGSGKWFAAVNAGTEASRTPVSCRKTTRRKAIIAEAISFPERRPSLCQEQGLLESLPDFEDKTSLADGSTSRRKFLLLSAASALALQTGAGTSYAEEAELPLAKSADASPTPSAESAGASPELSIASPVEVQQPTNAVKTPPQPPVVQKVQVGKEASVVVARSEKELDLDNHDKKLLEYNRRIQRLNNAPPGFPGFIREGFDVKVVAPEEYQTTSSGLIYLDLAPGKGDPPSDGQQVVFQYTGYNESGRRIDSSYQQGRPAETRVGINGMIPGFEEGIRSMRAGGVRRIVVPPELGPPTGPSTFFSAKQYEVFDVELLSIKTCKRRQVLFYSDFVCE